MNLASHPEQPRAPGLCTSHWLRLGTQSVLAPQLARHLWQHEWHLEGIIRTIFVVQTGRAQWGRRVYAYPPVPGSTVAMLEHAVAVKQSNILPGFSYSEYRAALGR